MNEKNIRVYEADLEAIRSAVIERLSLEQDDLHSSLRRELERSIMILGPEDSRLGRWVLTERESGLALVRIPPRNTVNYIFGATLEFEEGRWVVVDLFEERMMAR